MFYPNNMFSKQQNFLLFIIETRFLINYKNLEFYKHTKFRPKININVNTKITFFFNFFPFFYSCTC